MKLPAGQLMNDSKPDAQHSHPALSALPHTSTKESSTDSSKADRIVSYPLTEINAIKNLIPPVIAVQLPTTLSLSLHRG
jgi:hypothetical protein